MMMEHMIKYRTNNIDVITTAYLYSGGMLIHMMDCIDGNSAVTSMYYVIHDDSHDGLRDELQDVFLTAV